MAKAKSTEAADAGAVTQETPATGGAAGTATEKDESAGPAPGPESTAESMDIDRAEASGPAPAPAAPTAPEVGPPPAAVAGAVPVAPAPPPRRRSGGFVMPALGGVVAAGVGFGAAFYVLQANWSQPRSDLTGLTDALSAQALRLDELSDTVTRLGATTAKAGDLAAEIEATTALTRTLAGFRNDLDGLGTRLTAVRESFDALDSRLAALEKRPVDGGAASATALEAFGRDMATMRAEISTQRAAATAAQDRIAAAADAAESRIAAVEAEALRLKTEAEAVARQGVALAALRHLQAALENGAPIEDALAGLTAAGVAVPPVLTEQAQGIPSLATLRETYPSAARAALAAALRVQSRDAGLWARLGAFLRSQSGARSLMPRAGDDPDAILSRVEVALRTGDLPAAIAGLSGLPPQARMPMAEWLALAGRRIAAADAVAALVRKMNQGATE